MTFVQVETSCLYHIKAQRVTDKAWQLEIVFTAVFFRSQFVLLSARYAQAMIEVNISGGKKIL